MPLKLFVSHAEPYRKIWILSAAFLLMGPLLAQDNDSSRFNALYAQASQEYLADHIDEAKTIWLVLQEEAASAGESDYLGLALQNLALIEKRHANWNTAAFYLERALTAVQQLGNLSRNADIHKELGYAARKLNDLPRAEKHYRQATSLYTKSQNIPQVSELLNRLGTVERLQGKVSQAIQNHSNALKIYKKLKDPTGEAYSLSLLATSARSTGNLSQALEYNQKALNLYEKLPNDMWAEILASRIAAIQLEVDKDSFQLEDLGIEKEARAPQTEKSRQASLTQANELVKTGLNNSKRGNLEQATVELQEALQIYSDLEDKAQMANQLTHLGSIAIRQKDSQQACNFWQQAQQLFTGLNYGPQNEKITYFLTRANCTAYSTSLQTSQKQQR
ncbi:MAG: tetratricopeptide repeat protein [Gammaproteobacteria bacterium]